MKTFSRWPLAVFALALLSVLAGGAWFYRVREERVRQNVEANLQAIAVLKADQIVQWRAGRQADADVISESQVFAEGIARWMSAPQADTTERLLTQFRSLCQRYRYFDALLVDPGGQVLLSVRGYRGPIQEDAARVLATALRERRAVLSDLHAGPGDMPPHIDALAPCFLGNGDERKVLGAVVLQYDARQFLYPLIQSWPMPGDSAESLLVRRDGDAVLFLNDLRHQKDTALKLRIPLSRADLPAALVVQGKEGFAQGRDYRGVEVLAALKAIPDSPWFMVVKIDTAEAFAAWRRESALILALIGGLLIATLAGAGVLWQWCGKAHYRALYEAQAALHETQERYRTTLMSVGDAVIATDAEGRVQMLNSTAETLTGWGQEEARGRPLDDVFHILHEETRAPVENPVRRVIREGLVVGLGNHTVLLARDGTERAIADSGAPIRGKDGILLGVVLVFRDQTQERAAEKEARRLLERNDKDRRALLGILEDERRAEASLRESEAEYRELFENAREAIVIIDLEKTITDVNKFVETYGFRKADLIGRNYLDFVVEPFRKKASADFELLRQGRPLEGEFEVMTPVGQIVASYKDSPMVRGGQVVGVQAILTDITERKQAEAALRAREEQLELFFSQSLDGFFFMMLEEPVRWDDTVDKDQVLEYVFRHQRVTKANQAMMDQYGATPEQFLGRTPRDFWKHDLPGGKRLWREFFDKGQLHAQTREQRLDGTPIWIDGDYICFHNAEGCITGHFGVQRDITERMRAEQRLLDYRNRLRELAAKLTLAEEQERRRIAVGVHDQIGQRMALMKLALQSLNAATSEPGTHRHLEDVCKEIDEVIKDAHSLTFELSNPVLHEAGFANAVESWLVQQIHGRHGLPYTFEADDRVAPTDKDTGIALFQIVRELLANVVKHARARRVDVRIREAGDKVQITVQDDGIGFEPAKVGMPDSKSGGYGLFSVRERLEYLGGDIEIESAPGQGTCISIAVPVPSRQEPRGKEASP